MSTELAHRLRQAMKARILVRQDNAGQAEHRTTTESGLLAVDWLIRPLLEAH